MIFLVLYNLIISLKERSILEEKKKNASIQMLRYVNHEIRNPLNIINGMVHFTLDNLKDIPKNKKIIIEPKMYETIITDLSIVVGACNMLEHIVIDILDIDKLDSGKMILNNKWTNIHDFISDVEKTISQKIDEKPIIKLEKIYDKNMILFFDSYRMKQIILNFLTNSIKYTETGTITISVAENKDCIRFSVRDTGRGIRDDSKQKIFQPFQQIEADDTTRYGGVGLGLYLCKMLAERMEGKIGFESEYGRGSLFWVDFPKNIIQPLNLV